MNIEIKRIKLLWFLWFFAFSAQGMKNDSENNTIKKPVTIEILVEERIKKLFGDDLCVCYDVLWKIYNNPTTFYDEDLKKWLPKEFVHVIKEEIKKNIFLDSVEIIDACDNLKKKVYRDANYSVSIIVSDSSQRELIKYLGALKRIIDNPKSFDAKETRELLPEQFVTLIRIDLLRRKNMNEPDALKKCCEEISKTILNFSKKKFRIQP